jgi:hypothetical protein
MTEDISQNHIEFQGEVKGAQVGDHNIIYNYFYYRKEAKSAPADIVNEDILCPYRGLFHFEPNRPVRNIYKKMVER